MEFHLMGKLWEVSLKMPPNYPTQKARELGYLYHNTWRLLLRVLIPGTLASMYRTGASFHEFDKLTMDKRHSGSQLECTQLRNRTGGH